MVERRALVRHKTLIEGRIYFNNRMTSMDCIVRDVTEKGARLQVSESVALPDAFEIYLPNKDEHFRAQAQWRKGDQLGVSWTPDSAFRHKSESSVHLNKHWPIESRGSSARSSRCSAVSIACNETERRRQPS